MRDMLDANTEGDVGHGNLKAGIALYIVSFGRSEFSEPDMQKPVANGRITPEGWHYLTRCIVPQWAGPPIYRENAVATFCRVNKIDRACVEQEFTTFWLEAPRTVQ